MLFNMIIKFIGHGVEVRLQIVVRVLHRFIEKLGVHVASRPLLANPLLEEFNAFLQYRNVFRETITACLKLPARCITFCPFFTNNGKARTDLRQILKAFDQNGVRTTGGKLVEGINFV